jgi:hypothetical protein
LSSWERIPEDIKSEALHSINTSFAGLKYLKIGAKVKLFLSILNAS